MIVLSGRIFHNSVGPEIPEASVQKGASWRNDPVCSSSGAPRTMTSKCIDEGGYQARIAGEDKEQSQQEHENDDGGEPELLSHPYEGPQLS